MDEGRKRVLLIAAAILAARKLSRFDRGKRVPAIVAAITDAVRWAEAILKEIDERFGDKQQDKENVAHLHGKHDKMAIDVYCNVAALTFTLKPSKDSPHEWTGAVQEI